MVRVTSGERLLKTQEPDPLRRPTAGTYGAPTVFPAQIQSTHYVQSPVAACDRTFISVPGAATALTVHW